MALQKGIRIHQYLDDWLFQAGSLQLVYILVTRPERGQLDLKEGKVRPTLDQWLDFHFPSLLHPVDSVRNLGVWFDADFSFSEHIKRTCKACFLHMRDLDIIWISVLDLNNLNKFLNAKHSKWRHQKRSGQPYNRGVGCVHRFEGRLLPYTIQNQSRIYQISCTGQHTCLRHMVCPQLPWSSL